MTSRRKPAKLLGIICWMLRRHAWRRLRKGERTGQIDANWRICGRCKRMRTITPRKKATP